LKEYKKMMTEKTKILEMKKKALSHLENETDYLEIKRKMDPIESQLIAIVKKIEWFSKEIYQ
jgi:hypothetical protein